MATINLNSIQDFFEAGIDYCANKFKEFTPIIPYTYFNLKGLLFPLRESNQSILLKGKSKTNYLKHIPAYAHLDDAIDFEELSQFNQVGGIKNGIYYIVLADLVGSTKYLDTYGNEKAAERIINFVQASMVAFLNFEKVNKAYFLKEVGDSVLFIFSHANDVVRWHEAFNNILNSYVSHIDEPFEIRTCVHLGEVSLFDANPLCLSVSETFKMEKKVAAGKLVFSELAAAVAKPSLNGSSHQFKPYYNDTFKSGMQELLTVVDPANASV